MITAAKLMVVIGGDATGAQRALAGTAQELDAFGKQAQRVGDNLSRWVTLPLVGIGVAATKLAADFDRNMNVLQETSGATVEQMEALDKQAQALGADLTLPGTSAADAAEAMLELSKAGLSVNDTLTASRGVLQMSAAGQLSNAQAAEIAANAMNAFGLAGSEATRVADLLAAAANASSAEVTDMADALKMSSAVFASANVPIEDLTTAIAEMANAGIQGSDAGTSLKQMMLSLMAPTDKAAGLMRDLGINVYDAQGAMLPMEAIIGQFSTALGGLTQQQRNAALATIFGSDAVRAANVVLMGGVDAFNELKTAVTETGAAADLAAAMTEGLGGAWDKVKSSAETAMLAAIEPLEDDIVSLTDAMAEALVGFSELDEGARDLIVKLGLMAIATGPAIKGIGLLASAGSGIATLAIQVLEVNRAWQAGLTLQTALEVGFGATAVSLGALLAVAASGVAVWIAYNEQITKTNEEGQKMVSGAMANMLDEQVASGKAAQQVAFEFIAAQERVQQALDDTNPILRLFISNQEDLAGNYGELSQAAEDAALNYDDYRRALVMAADANGLLIDAEGNLVKQIVGDFGTYYELVEANYMVSEAEFEAARNAEAFGSSAEAAAMGMGVAGAAAMDAAPRIAEMAAAVEELAKLSAGDILGGLDDALEDAGWAAEEAEAAHERLAIALGELDPEVAALQNDMDLLSEAFAWGVVSEDEYKQAAQDAKLGTLELSDAQRDNLRASIEQARAFGEVARAAEEATLRQIEMAQSMSEMWTRAYESYQDGLERLTEQQQDIADRIAELQAKLKKAKKEGDTEAIARYKKEINELKGQAADAAVEVGKLADDMERTIDAAIASAAIKELQRMYNDGKGKITFEEYVGALTDIQESFGLTNDTGIGIAAGIAAISGAVEEGLLPTSEYAKAMGTLAEDAQDGVIDLEKLNQWILDVGGSATTASDEVVTGMDDAEKAMEGAETTAGKAADGIVEAFESVDWHELGAQIGAGIAAGILESMDQVTAAASDVANATSEQLADDWREYSPSRVFYEHARNAMLGLEMGLEENAYLPIEAMRQAALEMANISWSVPTTQAEMASSMAAPGGGGSEGIVAGAWGNLTAAQKQQLINLTVNVDGRAVREVMLSRLEEELA